MYQILLFYKYVHIEDPEAVAVWQRELQSKFGFKGRTIIAKEGVNITLEGEKDKTEEYIREVEKDPRFQNIHWKKSVGTGNAFPRLSVKVRPEIVSLHLGTCDVDPNETTGIHLKPEELHEWIKNGKEFYIVDMRNAYEHKVGHFEGSICPPMNNFRDLPKLLKQISHLKDKTVLTVCTGGVRCEKASGYLITQGFKDVYQLDGGIVSYMEKYPNEDFKGKLYVFDGRVVMGFYTDDPRHEIIGRCDFCETPCDRYKNCADNMCHNHILVCDDCLNKKDGKPMCPKGCHRTRSGKSIRSNFFQIIRDKINLWK
ncbi:MAG: rhodanese-related sulfurtransferase [Candidatus Pacebacteria bacterium]|nr:rhodanese-related sulfurtransferase [Candidatus Paceibacterota bacterium]MBP9058294.1 rhodanese-related sulfurtransferase [Candidatus Paceibacterota bacterium]